MRLATFNIYWLGDENMITRGEEDVKHLAAVVAKVNADVLVFQEIVAPEALREILDLADAETGRAYAMHDADDRLLGTTGGQAQMVVAAYDSERYELREAAAIRGVGHSRPPFGLRLRRKSDGAELTVVGVHFQSGWPDFTDTADANKRRAECERLAEWVGGGLADPGLRPPQNGERVAVLGDFNALYDSNKPAHAVVVESLEPLRTLKQGGWWWEKPLADPEHGGGRFSSYIDGYLIDHVLLSPSLKQSITLPPTIYAFDQDPAIGASGPSVSDHRPVYVELDV